MEKDRSLLLFENWIRITSWNDEKGLNIFVLSKSLNIYICHCLGNIHKSFFFNLLLCKYVNLGHIWSRRNYQQWFIPWQAMLFLLTLRCCFSVFSCNNWGWFWQLTWVIVSKPVCVSECQECNQWGMGKPCNLHNCVGQEKNSFWTIKWLLSAVQLIYKKKKSKCSRRRFNVTLEPWTVIKIHIPPLDVLIKLYVYLASIRPL